MKHVFNVDDFKEFYKKASGGHECEACVFKNKVTKKQVLFVLGEIPGNMAKTELYLDINPEKTTYENVEQLLHNIKATVEYYNKPPEPTFWEKVFGYFR